MAAVGNLFVRMGLKANEFYSGMNKVQKHTVKTGDSLRTIKRIAVAAFAGWGIKRLADSFVDAAVTTEGYRTRLTGLLGSVEEGNKLFAAMNQYAAQTPFEFEKIMESATALSGVMEDGVSEVTKWMPMIGDLAAATGLGIEQTTQQVIRMYSAGAASADLFRERGVLAMMGFQAGVSYTAQETRRMMMAAWEDPASKFGGMTEKLKKTWSGTMSMFRDSWFQFRNLVMDSGPFQAMKEFAQEILGQLKKLEKEGKLKEWADELGKTFIAVFSLGTLAAQQMWNSLDYGNFIFASLTKTAAGFGLALLEPYLKVLEFFQLISSYVPILGETIANFWQGGIDLIGGYVAELQHAQNASSMMMQDTVDSILEVNEFFDSLRAKLEEIKNTASGMGEGGLVEKEQVVNEELFDILGQRLEIYQGDSRARVMVAQKALFKISKMERKEALEETRRQQTLAKHKIQTAQNVANALVAISGKESGALFYIAKAFAVVQAIISAWVAYTEALAHPPGPPTTIPIAKWALASGLSAAALIAAQSFAGHQEGGWVRGGSGMRDDVLIGVTGPTAHLATGGEFVVNKESASENAELLEAINAGGTFGNTIIPITLELDGEVIWNRTYKASRDGDLQIHEGALVSR